MKKDKKIVVFEDESVEFPGTPAAFMQFWKDIFAAIPAELSDSARVCVESETYYDITSISVEVSYLRPETDEEEQAREKKERAEMASQEQKEREQLQRLLEKYPRS